MVIPLVERFDRAATKEQRSGQGTFIFRRQILGGAALALLFVLSVAVRLVGADLFITPDEDNWMRRTGNFSRALETRDLAETFQSGHPGVTTMWIARLGIGPEASRLAGITVVQGPVTRASGFMDLLVDARRAIIVVNTALLVLCVALGWRLLGLVPALLAGLLLAFEPFLIAHSQVVHVDGLSAGFISVAMLAAGVYWWSRGVWGYLVLCGVASGLAVLTKAPSLFLGLFIPTVALAAPLLDRGGCSWRRAVLALVLAGLVGLVTLAALWPALWVSPIRTLQDAMDYTIATSNEHRPGNYFLGQPVVDPGPLFYPVAIGFRIAPLTLAGLVALGILPPHRSIRNACILLLLFIVGFVLFLTVPSKKLDRYALPVWPALDLLAGLGYWTLGTWLVRLVEAWRPASRRLARLGLVGLLGAAQVLPLLMVSPYPLAYYNPLMGSAPTAARVMLVGWGEGLDQVAAYLNGQAGAQRQRIAIYFPQVLNFQGMVAGSVTPIGDPDPVDYVVDYVNAAQRSQTPGAIVGREPEMVVQINGLVYARVFRLTPPRPAV